MWQVKTKKLFRPLFRAMFCGMLMPMLAWASVERTNPVTGKTEEYENVFTGAVSTEWNNANNWDTDAGQAPFISGNTNYWSALVEAKTATTVTTIEGWMPRVGAYNGAHIEWNGGISKVQTANTVCWLTADETSTITISSFGGGQLNGSTAYPLKLTSANAGGITWNGDIEVSNSTYAHTLPFFYYLGGEGSVVYGGRIVSETPHEIKMADAAITGGEKEVKSKTLVSFASSTVNFTASAKIKFLDAANENALAATTWVTSVNTTGSPTLTTDCDVGACEIVQTSTEVILYWVDGPIEDLVVAEETSAPFIGVNFTAYGYKLTTSTPVGLEGFAIPGTAWNSMDGANGTLATVIASDAAGNVAMLPDTSIEISDARDYYWCSSLSTASDLRAGYIDENASYPNPTVKITGIPYKKYFAVVYCSTDTANVKFGYIALNGTNYTYVDGVLTEGTAAWGDTGPANSANPIAVGTNTLVSPVLDDSTLVVTGHRSGDTVRGGIAAIQIVDMSSDIEAGENDLLIELAGDTTRTVDSSATSEKVIVAGYGTLTLTGSGTITASSLHIDRNATVKMDSQRLGVSSVTGSGTALYDGVLPQTGKGWTDSENWTGTVWLRDFSGITGNGDASTGVQPNSLGNANSKVKFSGVSGWIEAPIEYNPEIVLENDTFDYALKLTNGNSPSAAYPNRATALRKLSGSGTLCSGGTSSATPALKVYDATRFAGSINSGTNSTGLVVIFCDENTTITNSLVNMFVSSGLRRTIYVAPDKEVTIADGATWSAKTGILVDGELCASSLDVIGASTTITTSDTGVFTLKKDANTQDHNVDFARITGSGTLRYADVSGHWRTLSPTNYPTAMITENNLSEGLILTVRGENVIGSLAGSGKIRCDWGGNKNTADRTLKILQAKDTEYSGVFHSDDRISSVTVAPGELTAGTLTLSGNQTATNDLIVAAGASVNLTGKWNGPVTVSGAFGGSGTLAGNLTFSEGAVLKGFALDSSGLSVTGTVTFPASGTVTIDTSDLALKVVESVVLLKADGLDESKFALSPDAPEGSSFAVEDGALTFKFPPFYKASLQLANTPYADGMEDAGSSGIYRIPAIAKATNGVVVALYDCRYTGGGDLPNKIDAAENWSGDSGYTWSVPKIGIDADNSGGTGKQYNFGDPSILYDPASNRFWAMGITGGGLAGSHTDGVSVADVVLYTRGTGENDPWEEWTGGPEGNTRSVKQMILDSLSAADDDAIGNEDEICGILQGPGHGMVQQKTVYAADGETVLMPAGALVFPMQYFPTSDFYYAPRAFAAYSTDGGETWKATKLSPSYPAQENCVMELDDGSWYMICKGFQRQLFRSTDYVNWTHVGALSPSAWVQGSCLRLGTGTDGKGRYVACFSPEGRENVTLYFGRDTTAAKPNGAGIAWDLGSKIVYPGSTGGKGYNSLVMLDETTLGILIEAQNHIYLLTEDVSDIFEGMGEAIFDWTPGEDPVGSWISSWSGETDGSPVTMVGPDGSAQSIYVVKGSATTWMPYQSYAAALDEFTLATYGCADMVQASSGKYAVLWCMGRRQNDKTLLAKDERGHILLMQVGPYVDGDAVQTNEIRRVIDAGVVKGYHLITVRFSTVSGASIQIDDGEVFSDPEFTTKLDETGFQVGTVRSGARDPLEIGNGFAVLKMLAFGSDTLDQTQFASLLSQYPAVATMDTMAFAAAGETLYLPSLTLESGKLSVNEGTLSVPRGVEASLSSLTLGNKTGAPVFGMDIAGTLAINTATTFSGNSALAAYNSVRYNRGAVFGEWSGTGTVNISGTFEATNAVVSLIHDAASVAVTVDGGVMRVKGVTAFDTGASLALRNGGLIDFGEYASFTNAIAKTYDRGTVTGTAGWTDTDDIAFTSTSSYTEILADGIDLKFTGELTGAGNIGINAINGGSVEFTNYRGTGAIAVIAGTFRIPSGTAMGGEVGVNTNAVLDIVADDATEAVLSAKRIRLGEGAVVTVNGEAVPDGYVMDVSGGTISIQPDISEDDITHDCVLRISEIMPKPTDDLVPGLREGMDVNGLESGWVEVENTSDKWADFADYKFTRTNRGKKTGQADYGNFPSRLIPPHGRAIFYTSERYSNSKDPAVSAFAEGTFNGAPAIFPEYGNILVWGDKVNPKKSPFVRLTHTPSGAIVDTVVIPSDIPEGWSIIVGETEEGKSVRRWLCPTPTRGTENTATTGLKRIGPNVGPLYENKTVDKKGKVTIGAKHDSANEFARPVPPAVPGEDYEVTFSFNPVMHPTEAGAFRDEDALTEIYLMYRADLDDSTYGAVPVDMSAGTYDAADWGWTYTAKIPASALPEPGHLIQWKFVANNAEYVQYTSPSFNNPDDGYEWYGTIVEAPELESANLPTWHMFATGNHLAQMDVDKDEQDLTLVTNYARIAIYDSSTSNYYDYVRIDLRGNTSAKFLKKGHGLRFAKAHPLTMRDAVTGEEIEEIRKTSLISEYADPSYMRQMIAFWLWRKMGNKVPFDFPVRCNLNGEFYQLAFNSERFTDELIEDVYGLDKFGYGYKNVGTLNSGDTTAGKIEKKTPDDENETDISMLSSSLIAPLRANGAYTSHTVGETAALTKFVVEKFDLPAWLNYLASARITHEMDDVWANVCAYLDDPQMTEGVRGTGTWMPLGYDFNLSFGQYYISDLSDPGAINGLTATNDWYKSHPFYGGWSILAHKSDGGLAMNGNNGFEAIYQSPKFRRLYLRRLRTLMDQELKAPGTAEDDTPFMAKMREMAELMRADADLDQAKWPNNTSDDNIDVWKNITRPENMDAAIDEIWNDYVVPRREHLYVTHSVTNTAKEVGFGAALNAGIPKSQSSIAKLAPNITIQNMTALGEDEAAQLGVDCLFRDTEAVVIRNDNGEAVDMSGWRLAFGADFTSPAGTVCDANDCIYIVADRRTYIETHEDDLTDEVIVGNATITGSGPIALYDASGYIVYSKAPETNEAKYLRLHSFCGNTANGGDEGEWFVLTNISETATLDLADVTVCFLKQGDDHATTDHCHITLENKKGSGELAPLASMRFDQADWTAKGWVKIQNNKQDINIYDKYGSVCQSLKVEQKKFPLAYGYGGWLVCDSTDATVTSNNQWHEDTDIVATFLPGEHGSLSGDSVQKIKYGEAPVPPAVEPDEGWVFAGWDGDVTAAMTGPVTFTATWAVSLGGALDATGLSWQTDGDAPWTGEIADGATGGQAARSGAVGAGQMSILSTVVEGAGTLSFLWKAACRERVDAVRLEVDGSFVRFLTGQTDWTGASVTLGPGTHTIRWIYVRGRGGDDAEENAVWVDDVVWTVAADPTLADALGDFDWETEGDVAWRAIRSESAYEGGIFAIADGLADDEESIIRTYVEGPGRLVFRWAVSCETWYDWLDFMVDGEVEFMTTGETGWEEVSIDLTDGSHTLEWIFWKDSEDGDDVGANCAMLDYVRWYPAGEEPPSIGTASLDAFYAWLKANHQLTAEQQDAAEASVAAARSIARSMLGSSAQGKSVTLLREFIAGTNPEDENDSFTASISFDADGNPVITPSTGSLTDEEIAMREYVTFGKLNLSDDVWTPITGDLTTKDFRFFKVEVKLK